MSDDQRPADVVLPGNLFSPRSIAILGASAEPGKLAHRPLDFLHRHGYPGAVYPINPQPLDAQPQQDKAFPLSEAGSTHPTRLLWG